MKVRREGTDVEIEFSIISDNHRCEEYVLLGRPISNNDETPLKECYVAVTEDTHIAVLGFVTGTIRQARFDLIVDGSWVGDRLVEADREGGSKVHHRRRIEFKTVNSKLEESATEPTTDRAKIVDGELTASALPSTFDPQALVGIGDTFGVGSIVIIASLEQYPTSGYLPNLNEYPDRTLGSWIERELEPRNPGILPTHSMELRNVNDNIIKQKGNKMQYRFESRKFGYKPFAKLIFNYRSKEALNAAGVIPAPSRTYKVEGKRIELPPISSPKHQSVSPIDDDLSQTPSLNDPCIQTRLLTPEERGTLPTWFELTMIFRQERLARQQAGLLLSPRIEPSDQLQRSPYYGASHGEVAVKEEFEDNGVLIQVAEHDHELPPIRIICEMIPKTGISIFRLLQILLPDMTDENKSEAAKLLLHYLQDHAALRLDQRGRQMVIKRQHLSELKQQSLLLAAQQQADEQSMSTWPSLTRPSKRMRLDESAYGIGDHQMQSNMGSVSQLAGRDPIVKIEPGLDD